MKRPYLPTNAKELLIWLRNFKLKLEKYAEKYGITKEELEYVSKALEELDWLINCVEILDSSSSSFKKFRKEFMGKLEIGDRPSDIPTLPNFPAAPPGVSPDLLGRITSIVNRIKDFYNYTEADGADMGIEGAEVVIDKDNVKAVLVASLVPEGVKIKCFMGFMEGYALYVRRNKGELIFLGNQTRSTFIDVLQVKPGEEHLECEYMARYIFEGKQIGKMSDVVTIFI